MPKTADYFRGKTIIITGAASGIGKATSRIFAREGANVVCADISADGAGQTAGEIGGKGEHHRLPLSVAAAVLSLIQEGLQVSCASRRARRTPSTPAGSRLR